MTETKPSMSLEKLGKWILAAVLLVSVFVGLQSYFTNLDVSMMPIEFQEVFTVVKGFFMSSAVLIAIAIIRNGFGYFVEWTRNSYKESFQFQKYLTTVGYYVGLGGVLITSMTALDIPAEWKTFAMFLLVIVDLMKQALKTVDVKAVFG